MLLTDGERKVVASSLMWATGVHFVQAGMSAKLGHATIAAEKADFAKECMRLFTIFHVGGRYSLNDADGPIVAAALKWAAMEHAKTAGTSAGADRRRREHFAGECDRLVAYFK